MAVLSKIRQRSLLLILVIGFCLLAFIIGDIINSGGFGGPSRNAGTINGRDIPAQEFMLKMNNVMEGRQGISSTQAANMVWNQEVENIIFQEKFEEANLRVGRDHILDIYSQDPQIGQNPQFLNAAGKFDKAKFNEFLVNMKSSNPDQWRFFESNQVFVENAAKKQLYLTMIKSGFFVTENDSKLKYKQENDKVNFDYVYLPYTTINDDEVKVSDQEITEYMKKNEKKYKSEASRDLEFVILENKPSSADEKEIEKSISELLTARVVYNDAKQANDTIPGFREATNIEEFVNTNSDVKYDTNYVAKKDLPLEYAEQLYNLSRGEVFGPYIYNGYYCITKMVDKKANATAKASHILIAYAGGQVPNPAITRTKDEAKEKAEDLLKQINANPDAFAELAKTHTDDPGSANTGGEYDNIQPGQMVKPFNDFVFNNPVGKTGIVETDFGYHVIKVTGKNEAVKLATIAQRIEASEATNDELFAKAARFESESEKSFEDIAKEINLTAAPANKIMATDENIPGIGNQRAIVKWAFSDEAKEGSVRKFDIPQGHVIVKVKNINKKGFLPIEEAKTVVGPILRNKKKAELLKAKMEGTTLEAVAQKTGSSIANANEISIDAPVIPSVGTEPKVVGTAFAIGQGKTSKQIEGQTGVFMISTKTITKAADLPNYSSYATRLKSQNQSVPNRISTALKNKAKIEDNRAEFY